MTWKWTPFPLSQTNQVAGPASNRGLGELNLSLDFLINIIQKIYLLHN